jgi:hypothetical protein
MVPIADKEQWRKQYRETVELLETIRMREIKALTDERAWEIIQSLACFGEPWRERPDWSGLVEQQAVFRRRKST